MFNQWRISEINVEMKVNFHSHATKNEFMTDLMFVEDSRVMRS